MLFKCRGETKYSFFVISRNTTNVRRKRRCQHSFRWSHSPNVVDYFVVYYFKVLFNLDNKLAFVSLFFVNLSEILSLISLFQYFSIIFHFLLFNFCQFFHVFRLTTSYNNFLFSNFDKRIYKVQTFLFFFILYINIKITYFLNFCQRKLTLINIKSVICNDEIF